MDKFEYSIKTEKSYTGKKKSYTDIVIGDKPQGTIMLETVSYVVSTKVAVTTDMK